MKLDQLLIYPNDNITIILLRILGSNLNDLAKFSYQLYNFNSVPNLTTGLTIFILMRLVYFVLGWVFFTVGFIGAFVPVLPTTPFMLLALWSFSHSSRRFHDWLYTHKLFGSPLRQWQENRVIPLAAKRLALFFMGASLVYLYFFSDAPLWASLLATVIMMYGAWFILSKPSRPHSHL